MAITQKSFKKILDQILNKTLTLTIPNFLNGVIHLSCMELSIIFFRDIKMKT